MSERIEQIIEIIEQVRRDFQEQGRYASIKAMRINACQSAARRRAISYRTVVDKISRQLRPDVASAGDFDQLLEGWLLRASDTLHSVLLRHVSDDRDSILIENTFRKVSAPHITEAVKESRTRELNTDRVQIEHTLDGTQVQYGYIWWKRQDNSTYRQIFPDGEVTINLQGKTLPRKKVDWNRPGISIGRRPMQGLFQKGDIILISKAPDGMVIIRKKGVVPPPPSPERLIAMIARILKDLKLNRKKSCAPGELYRAYSWMGLDYQLQEIENALNFLSTPPFGFFDRHNEDYVLVDDIERILQKMSLLQAALDRMQGQ